MAFMVYKSAVLLVSGREIAGEMHDLSLEYSADSLERTTFGSDTHVKAGGLYSATLAGEAYADFAALAPDLLYGLIATNDVPLAIFPAGVTEGAACGYAMKGVATMFDLGGDQAALPGLKFQFDAAGVAA